MIKTIQMYLRRFSYEASKKKLKAVQDLAMQIGFFYLSLQKGTEVSHYNKAVEEVSMLGISQLDIKGNQVSITLTRPGILIGRKGSTIDALTEFLSKHYKKKISINIIEDKVLQYLAPYYPGDDDF